MDASTPIKLFVIDDSEILVSGIKSLLIGNTLVSISGYAGSANEVLQSKELLQSDVVLLDLMLEGTTDGFELIDPILALNQALKIVVLTCHKDVNTIVKSVQKGVSAYIGKDSSIDELIAVLQLVMKGNGFFFGETIPRSLLLDCFPDVVNTHPKPWNLTEREIEIIALLTKGFISKEIAGKLKINISTVESHKDNIKRKLNCKTVIDIVVFALKNGLVD
jgi:two-component system response regulator NreC